MGGGKTLAPAWWWSRVHLAPGADPQLAPLRLFCRLRGIELPYRGDSEHGRRAGGLAAAVERAVADGRPDQVVILSDLTGIVEDEERVRRALARARRHAGGVVALVPQMPAFSTSAATDTGKLVASILTREHRRAFTEARALLARAGVRVIAAGPHDTPALLLGHRRRAA